MLIGLLYARLYKLHFYQYFYSLRGNFFYARITTTAFSTLYYHECKRSELFFGVHYARSRCSRTLLLLLNWLRIIHDSWTGANVNHKLSMNIFYLFSIIEFNVTRRSKVKVSTYVLHVFLHFVHRGYMLCIFWIIRYLKHLWFFKNTSICT